jgi:hypothetical protein
METIKTDVINAIRERLASKYYYQHLIFDVKKEESGEKDYTISWQTSSIHPENIVKLLKCLVEIDLIDNIYLKTVCNLVIKVQKNPNEKN